MSKGLLILLFCFAACKPAPPPPAEAPAPKPQARPESSPLPLVTADLHVDTVYHLLKGTGDFADPGAPLQSHLPLLEEGGVNLQVFAIWPPPEELKGDNFPYVVEAAKRLKSEFEKHAGRIALARDSEEAKAIIRQGKIAAVLSIEGAHALDGKLENLRKAYDLGIRSVGITWNNTNPFADGVKGPKKHGGLSPLGERLIQEMNRLGMIVDVSHASPETFAEVLQLSQAPLIASHSNARAVADHPRNLSDKQILALKAKGGVMGINFHSPFLRRDGQQATAEDVVRHVLHIRELAGSEVLALGSDYDGLIEAPSDLPHAGFFPKLRERLRGEGLDNEELKQMFGENFLRLWEKVGQTAQRLRQV